MSTARILTLATMAQVKEADGKVTASAKGLTYETMLKPGEGLTEAMPRALSGLLAKVDAVSELLAKLGPKPAPLKPRGVAVARMRAAQAPETLDDDTVVIDVEDPPAGAVHLGADPKSPDMPEDVRAIVEMEL